MDNPFDVFDGADNSVNPFDQFDAPTRERPGLGSAFKTSFKKGVSSTAGLLTEVLPALAYSVAGDSESAQQKLAEYKSRIEKLPPSVIEDFTKISNPTDALYYIAEALGENAPSLALGMGTGGVGAFAAKKLGTSMALGAAAGATVGSAAQNIPETFAEVEADTGEQRPGVAFTFGAAKSALDAIPAWRAVNTLTKPAQEAILKRVLREAGIQFLAEGATETAQAGLDEFAKAYIKENHDVFSPENVVKYVDTFLKAGITGGALGGGSAALQRRQANVPTDSGKPEEYVPNFQLVDEPSRPFAEDRGYISDEARRADAERRFEAAGRRNLRQDNLPEETGEMPDQTLGFPELPAPEGPRGYLPPPSDQTQNTDARQTTPYGELSDVEIDELLSNNSTIPEVAQVLSQEDLSPHVRRVRGLEALARVPEGTIGGRGRQPAQDPRTPLEALSQRPETPALSGEQARARNEAKYNELVKHVQENFSGHDVLTQSMVKNKYPTQTTAKKRYELLERMVRDGYAYKDAKGQYRAIVEKPTVDGLASTFGDDDGNVVDLKARRSLKNLSKFHKSFAQEVSQRAQQMAEESAKHPWTVEVGDRVSTEWSDKNGVPPYIVHGRILRRGVPFLQVSGLQAGEKAKFDIPEKAIKNKYSGPQARESVLTGEVLPRYDGEITLDEQQKLEKIIRDVTGGKVSPMFMPAAEAGTTLKDLVESASGPTNVEGLGRPVSGFQWGDFIGVATDRGWEKALDTTWHESFHYAQSRLLTPEEIATLNNDLPNIYKVVDREYPGWRSKYPENVHGIEAQAVAASIYMQAREGMRPMPAEFKPPVRRALEKIYQFFTRLWNEFRGSPRAERAADVFERFGSGEVGRRAAHETRFISDYNGFANALNEVKQNATYGGYKRASDLNLVDRLFKHLTAIADKYPQFRPYFDAVDKGRSIRSTVRAENLRDFAEAEADVPMNERWKIEQFAEAAEYIKDAVKMTGGKFDIVVPADAKVTLSKPGDRLTLDGPMAKAYAARQQALLNVRNRLVDSMLERLGYKKGTTVKELKAMGDEKAAELADLIMTFNQHPNYNPHMRFGNVGITVKDKDGNNVYYRTFDLLGRDGSLVRRVSEKLSDRETLGVGQFRRAYDELKKQFPGTEYTVSDPFPVTYDRLKSIMGNPLADLRVAADMFGSGDPAVMKELLDDLETAITKRGMRGQLAERKNIPGWLHQDNKNVYGTRAITNYVVRASDMIARNETAKDIQGAMDSLKKSPNLYKYATEHQTYLNNGYEEAQVLRNTAFFWFLGFNMSSALINATQVIHSTFPVLSALGGTGRATADIGRAVKDTVKILGDRQVIGDIAKGDVFAILNTKKPASVDTDKWEALQRAIKSGVVIPMQAFEQAGITVGEHETLTGGRRNLARFAQIASSWFGTAESFNRMSTFLAAYDMARHNPKALANSETVLGSKVNTPEEFALRAVERTQFIMDKTNRPEFMRGNMSVPTQFMSYPVQMLELASKLLLRSGWEGKKALALMGLMMIATSGVWSVPGGENAKDLVEALYKFFTDHDIDLDKEVRELSAEIGLSPDMISRGIIPKLTNLSLAGRTGAGQIINPQMFSGNMESMVGPAGGMIVGSVKEAVNNWKDDKPMMAFASLMPTFIKNIAKAKDITESGYRSRAGTTYRRPEDINIGDVVRQATGFRPETVGEAQALDVATRRLGNSLDQITQRYHNRLANLLLEQRRATDTEDRAEAGKRIQALLEDVREYNRGKKPFEMIKLSRSSVQQKVAQSLRGEPNLRAVPKRMRGEAHDMRQLYGRD